VATTLTTSHGFFDYVSNSSNQIDYDYDRLIDYDDTGSRWDISAFLMRKENSEKVGSPEFYTWEGAYAVRTTTCTEAVTTTETSITMATGTGKYFRVGDIARISITFQGPGALTKN